MAEKPVLMSKLKLPKHPESGPKDDGLFGKKILQTFAKILLGFY